MVRTLVKHIPKWLSSPPAKPVLNCLIELWEQRISRFDEENVTLSNLKQNKMFIKCFLNYCHYHREAVDLLFYMVSILTTRSTTDYSFLKDFYIKEVSENYSQKEKKAVLTHFLEFFQDKNYSEDHKVQTLKNLIIPMLTASFVSDDYDEIIDSSIISSLITNVLCIEGTLSEPLNIELLSLTTLLIRYLPIKLLDFRKELIKFAWNYLKSEDITTRQSAHVLVSRFIECYETPPKIILQVYVALLRAHQPEAKSLVKEALSVLTESFHNRLNNGNPADAKFPTWLRWTKKIIVEESYSLPQLTHILQLIVRHPQHFYRCRGQFVLHMVNSLARIGLTPNNPTESRKLSIDLVELILTWERQAIHEPETNPNQPEEGAKMEIVQNKSTESKFSEENYRIPLSVGEMIVNFLIRIASNVVEPTPSSGSYSQPSPIEFSQRATDLLKQSLTLWPNVPIKFAYFEKIFVYHVSGPAIPTTLNILNAILDFQPKKLTAENLTALEKCIAPAIHFCTDQKVTYF